jgi:hypothetical protein
MLDVCSCEITWTILYKYVFVYNTATLSSNFSYILGAYFESMRYQYTLLKCIYVFVLILYHHSGSKEIEHFLMTNVIMDNFSKINVFKINYLN